NPWPVANADRAGADGARYAGPAPCPDSSNDARRDENPPDRLVALGQTSLAIAAADDWPRRLARANGQSPISCRSPPDFAGPRRWPVCFANVVKPDLRQTDHHPSNPAPDSVTAVPDPSRLLDFGLVALCFRLEPFGLFEFPVQKSANAAHQPQGQGIAQRPLQFRHVFE